MYDNGLLKCYPKFLNKYGCLDLAKLGKVKNQGSIYKVKDTKGIFSGLCYAKDCFINEMQIEVLTSQIVADFGLDTAIYLPGMYKGSLAVISNDVQGKDGIPFDIYLGKHKALNFTFKSPYDSENYSPQELGLREYFTQKGLKEYADAHIIRTACGDIDGHGANIIVRPINAFEGYPGTIDSVSLIDYSYIKHFISAKDKEDWLFYNGLGGGFEKTRDEMIEVFKNNEIVQDFYSNSEIAEKLGNIDVHGHVTDIKETIGLEINPIIESEMARNIDYVAEAMMK